MRGRAWQPARALALAGLVAACQPLPRPFADDLPPPGLITVRDTAGVTVAGIEGAPPATAAKLGPAVAQALRDRDIAATDRSTSLSSYQLYGRIEKRSAAKGRATLVASWRLRDPTGRVVAEHREQAEAAAADWDQGSDEAVSRLAAATAAQLARLIQDEPPAETPGGGRTRLRIAPAAGAPGDGDSALAGAIAAVLKRRDIDLVTDPQAKADLVLDAKVSVSPVKAGRQHVAIVWHLRRPDGGEIGTVGQENDVPAGLLGAAWGDVAYMVALSAENGIMALVARGAPPPKSAS